MYHSQLIILKSWLSALQTKSQLLEETNTVQLRGKKIQDVFTKVYDLWETIFSNQTGKFPSQSQRGNKYIMVMAEDKEMIRSYDALVLRLKRAGHSQQFPTVHMGPAFTPNRSHSQFAWPIQLHTNTISILAPIKWTIRLQQNAISTDGMWRTSTQENGQTRYLGDDIAIS